MIVAVVFALVGGEEDVEQELRRLRRRHAAVVRQRSRGRQRGEIGDRRGGTAGQVHEAGVWVSPRLDRPTRDAACACEARRRGARKQRERQRGEQGKARGWASAGQRATLRCPRPADKGKPMRHGGRAASAALRPESGQEWPEIACRARPIRATRGCEPGFSPVIWEMSVKTVEKEKRMSRLFLLLVIGGVLFVAAPCAAGVTPCKFDGLRCRTNEDCCSGVCTANVCAAHHCQAFPATGQTTSFHAFDDGAMQAGAPLSYTDNGDGTITDENTGLMWEKKSADGNIHDMDTLYTWNEIGRASCRERV